MRLSDSLKIDKTVVSIGLLADQGNDREFWVKKTPSERLQALEVMRQVMYGYDPSTARLQRAFTISERKES